MRILATTAALLALSSCGDKDEATKSAVRELLNDPGSAQFKQIMPCAQGTGYFGSVNWRNASGGYGDFMPFIVIDGRANVVTLTEQPVYDAAAKRCYSDAILNASGNEM